MGASNRAKPKKRASLPDFDENALAQLTSKIDKSLPNPEAFPAKRKRPNGAEDGPDSKRRQTQPAKPKPKQKEREKIGKKTRRAVPSSLLEEILALGGDEADLELVANVDSGNEDGDTPKPKTPLDAPIDQAFQDELANFASTLGFQKIQQDEDLDTEEEAEDIEETRAGESEDEDEHEAEEPETTTAGAQKETRSKNAGKLMFEPRSDWYAVNTERLPSSVPDDIKRYSSSIANLKSYADSLLEEDSATYSAMQASTSTQRFMSTIMSSGTLSDKVSALTLSIQESPLHSRKAFENLIALAGKKSRGQAIAALGALVDLLGNGMVLPSERRLRPFSAQPALLGSLAEQPRASWTKGQKLPGNVTKSHLMMWAYEDWLKGAYFRIIQLLEVWCADEIEYSRSRALDFVYGLLKDKPEQEANLLRLLVNKLGDRDRKIASRASYLLLQLLNLHPGMKAVVISAVEHEVLLKPTQSLRTRYYAINTLNQTILSSKEPAIADTLLRIYFDIFLALLKSGSLGDFEAADTAKKSQAGRKKNRKRKGHGGDVSGNDQETSQKLVSAVLTGVNRAIPFTTTDESTLEKHLDTLFRITHSSNFNTSVQALMLIQQLAASKHLAVDRFYRTLYESLLDPRLVTSSKQALYLNLLYRSLKNDVDVRRVKAFVKRMVQILSLHQPSFACGVLFLIAELEGPFPDLHALLTVPEDQGDDGEEVYKDVTGEESPKDAAPQEAVATGGRHSLAYDGRKRDPEHSNAHQSCLWELIPFLSHFHPSVCVFASNLLARQNSLPKPELANHTLMHFLDKFVYRNPKAAESKRGGSIMQPVLASGSVSHVVVSSKASAKQQPVVNSASFWNLKPEQVSAEDVFFHEYFARIGKPGEAPRSKNTGKDDAVVAGSDGEEDEIWEALVNSRPEVQGEGDGDSDLDMEGYEDSDDEDLALADGAKGASIGEDVSDLVSEGSGDDMAFEGIFDDSGAEGDSDGDDDGSDDGHGEVASGKERQRGRLNRKEMRSLPTFASADDYAEMLGAEEDGLDDQ